MSSQQRLDDDSVAIRKFRPTAAEARAAPKPRTVVESIKCRNHPQRDLDVLSHTAHPGLLSTVRPVALPRQTRRCVVATLC